MSLERVQIAVRKRRTNYINLAAGVLKEPSQVKEIIFEDIGYRFMKTIRGSPSYFEQITKDLFAAETQFIHLLQILAKVVHGDELSEKQASDLTWGGSVH